MSASHICPQCAGTTFRQVDENNYILCECLDLGDDGKEAKINQAFMCIHDALCVAGYEKALDKPCFCGMLLKLATAAVEMLETAE